LSPDTCPIWTSDDILLLYACLHVENVLNILCELLAQLSILFEREVRDLDAKFFGFGYGSA
jgi:hypothetical protein